MAPFVSISKTIPCTAAVVIKPVSPVRAAIMVAASVLHTTSSAMPNAQMSKMTPKTAENVTMAAAIVSDASMAYACSLAPKIRKSVARFAAPKRILPAVMMSVCSFRPIPKTAAPAAIHVLLFRSATTANACVPLDRPFVTASASIPKSIPNTAENAIHPALISKSAKRERVNVPAA